MNLRRLIGRLLAVLVIGGLIFAPLVIPAAAKRLAAAEMSDIAMSSDTQCCADGHKNSNCKDCPLVAMCMLTIAQAEPSSTNTVPVSFQVRSLSFVIVDLTADGLIGSPPDHPPRIST